MSELGPESKETVDSNNFLSIYQSFIHKSRYARYLKYDNGLDRRETFVETIDRYVNYMFDVKCDGKINDKKEEIRNAILNLEILPSMRAMMTSGKALDQNEICGYNCSFLNISKIRSFSELFMILLCGTGVGLSVEQQNIEKLPQIPDELYPTDTTIVVGDSKLGWTTAFQQLLSLMINDGLIASWDVKKVRKKGSVLKSMGGRSSGPEPLVELFEFCINIIKGACGRKLNALEVTRICCKAAECVIVGGVRRSALIVLSSDPAVLQAKRGAFYNEYPELSLCNISKVYETKPSILEFMKDWEVIVESKAGEPGIFNRYAANNVVKHIYDPDDLTKIRREPQKNFGTNPSLRRGTKLLTTSGIFNIEDLENKEFEVLNLNNKISKAKCFLSGHNKKLFKLTLSGGHEYYSTKEHKWPVYDSEKNITKYETYQLEAGMKLPVIKVKSLYENTNGTCDEGYTIGYNIVKFYKDTVSNDILDIYTKFGITKDIFFNKTIWNNTSDEFKSGLLHGLFNSIGAYKSLKSGVKFSFRFAQETVINDLSELLGFYGIQTIKSSTSVNYVVDIISQNSQRHFYDIIRNNKMMPLLTDMYEYCNILTANDSEDFIELINIEETNLYEDVWDITVYDDIHCFMLSHCMTGNCSEIILRDSEFCNLTTCIIREHDTIESMKKKIEYATILGTMQATLTNFKYINKQWQKNCEEERLLGVSLNGICDNAFFAGLEDKDALAKGLVELKEHACRVNKKYAEILGINPAAAISCIKPEGTTSQLVGCSSGIHPTYSPYYIRRVRASISDPLCQFMGAMGIPFELDVINPDKTVVFSFPIKSYGKICRKDMSAIDQLELWKIYQTSYCEHKPSITVYIKENEWLEVADFVYKNFDYMSGVAFLPYSDHMYRQAPYEEITEEQYNEMMKTFPKDIDFSKFKEDDDRTTGSQELACTGGACELVDIITK